MKNLHATSALAILMLCNGAAIGAENVKAWGMGWYGQLGNGVSYFWEDGSQETPTVVPGLSSIKAVAAGAGFSLALKTDGTVSAWGSINGSNVPISVPGITGVSAVAAGGGFELFEPWSPYPSALFLKSDGTVWAWNDSHPSPVAVAGLTGVTAISVGSDDGFAVKQNGTVWRWCMWCTDGSQVPTQAGGLTNVKTLAADAWGNGFVLKNDGTVWIWQIWYGTPPVQVSGLTGVTAIAPYIVRRSDGTAWILRQQDDDWMAVDPLANVQSVTPDIAARNDGSVWEYGDFDYDDDYEWQAVSGINGVTSVAARSLWDGGHRVALKSNGTVSSWGWNRWGQLGNGGSLYTSVPRGVKSVSDVVAVSAGDAHSLALKRDGTVWNWGCEWVSNEATSYDMLQPCGSDRRLWPQQVTTPTGSPVNGVVAIAAGGTHSLALKNDGSLLAWGRNNAGQLGNGQTDEYWGWGPQAFDPVSVSGLANVVAISAGGVTADGLTGEDLSGHSLALKNDGTVWAWGLNTSGQLGNGTDTDTNVPVKVNGLAGVVAIAGGHLHSLALKSDGTVWAWGWNGFGQLGNGNRIRSNVPVAVVSLTGVVAIAAGENFSLALRSDGTVWGWGANFNGQLGNGTNASSNVPVAMSSLTGVTAISAGTGYSLMLKSNGVVWSSGDTSNVPVPVSNLASAVAVEASAGHHLAIVQGGIPGVALSSKSLSFASQNAGTTSAAKSLNITNSGDQPLNISAVTLLGVHASEFSKTSDNCSAAVLVPGGSCGMNVTFAPTASGSRNAALLVTSNAPGSSHLVSLTGTGAGGPTITVGVIAPNGGEKLYSGSAYTIEWTASSGVPISKFDVQYSTNGGSSFNPVLGCTGLAGTVRSCVWAAPGPVTTAGRIRVVASDSGSGTGSDVSNANYTVAAGKAAITVTVPNTVVNWALGSEQLIKWTHNLGTATSVRIEVSRDSGATWNMIVPSTKNTGSYLWKVDGPATSAARIRVSWSANPAVQDVSNANFLIATPFLTVTKPNGGEKWKKSSTQTVTWTSNLGSSEFVKIELSTNGGVSWLSVAEAAQASLGEDGVDPLGTLVASTPSDGSQTVKLPATTSTQCRVRVTWLDNAVVSDTSNANFSIIP